jgi:hypothetical protein
LISRTNKEQIVKLRKLLSETSKTTRHRRNLINIHITILNWLVELIGFFFLPLGSAILGHDNSIVTLSLQSLTILFFFNILPCTFLINKSELKGVMADSTWYVSFLSLFHLADYQKENQDENEADEEHHPVRNIPNEEHINNDGENEADKKKQVVKSNPDEERINNDGENEAHEENHVVRNNPNKEHINHDGENESHEEIYVVRNIPNEDHINNDGENEADEINQVVRNNSDEEHINNDGENDAREEIHPVSKKTNEEHINNDG